MAETVILFSIYIWLAMIECLSVTSRFLDQALNPMREGRSEVRNKV